MSVHSDEAGGLGQGSSAWGAMLKGKRIFVVIPAYNVEAHIAEVVRGIPEAVDEIIVVDDHSGDSTGNEVNKLNDKRVTLIRHETNRGVGGATITGLRCAVEKGADIVIKMDGDNQMDPRYIEDLAVPIIEGKCHYAKGNRFFHTKELSVMPKIRLIGNFVLAFLTKLASGYWTIFDPQNGYLAIDATALGLIDLDRISKRYFFENDMLIHMNIFGLKVKDVPIPSRYGKEKSSMKITGIFFTFPFYLVKRYWYRVYQKYVLREFSPIVMFLYLGVPLLLWGALFGGYTWFKSIYFDRVATTGTVMLSVLPLILGFELILQAVVLEINDSKQSER